MEKNSPVQSFAKADRLTSPTPTRALVFDTEKQRNTQFLNKGLSKPGRVTFEVLRRAVQSTHIARICVNTLKEKITKTAWVIKPIDKISADGDGDKRIKEVTELFKHPNKADETFRTLLDKLLEDLLILDVGCMEKTRYPDGELAELHYVDGSCYSDDTEVLTKGGWKRFKEVDITKDIFATRNQISKEFEWQKASYKHHADWDGDMYHFNSRTVDLLVSPNHRILYTFGSGNNEYRKEFISKAEDVYKISGFTLPATSYWKGVITSKRFYIKNENKKHGGYDIDWDINDYVSFMGMYLSEGCIEQGGVGNRIYISQKQESKGFEEFKELLIKLFGKEPYYDGKVWQFRSKTLWNYLKQFGKALDKFVPENIKEMPIAQLSLFYHFYWLGDGSGIKEEDHKESIYTSSKKMSDDLQEIIQKMGFSSSILKRIKEKDVIMKDGRIIKKENCAVNYIVSKRTSRTQSANIEKTQYKGDIWCVSVPNEILYVRRNGQPIWCGNTIRPVFNEFGEQDIEIPMTTTEGTVNLPTSYIQVMDNSQYGGPESGQVVASWAKKDFIRFMMHPQGSMAGIGYGLSPIESVVTVVANILNAENFNATYFEEGSFPPVIIQLMGQVNQRDIQLYREYLQSELSGNYHRPAIMAGGTDAKVLNLKDLTNRDMEFMEYMKFMARLLAAAYGLSGQDIGLTDEVGSKNVSETQRDISHEKGYSSILHLLKEVFNQEIIWKDFGYQDLEFEWVSEDNLDPSTAADIYTKHLQAGTMTLNEVRTESGKDPYEEWADKPMVLTSTGYVPIIAPTQGEEGVKDEDGKDLGDKMEEGVKEEFEPEKTKEKNDKVVGGERHYSDQDSFPDKKKSFVQRLFGKIRKTTFKDEDEGFEFTPVMFGTLITDDGLKTRIRGIFHDNNIKGVSKEDMEEIGHTFNFENAKYLLAHKVEGNPRVYGGILKFKNINKAKYCVYIKEM